MQKSIASIYETSINDKFPFYSANVIYIFPDKNIMESNTLLLIKLSYSISEKDEYLILMNKP